MLTELLPGEDDSLKVAATNAVNTILNIGSVNDAMASRYSAFVRRLSSSSWDNAPFKGHLDSALSNLVASLIPKYPMQSLSIGIT
jgi:hypothetical protein